MISKVAQHSIRLIVIFAILVVVAAPIAAQGPSSDCARPTNHPWIQLIEDQFGYTFDAYSDWYCNGITLSGIAQAMELETQTGIDFNVFLDILANSTQTEAMMKLAELGVTVSRADIAPGKIFR